MTSTGAMARIAALVGDPARAAMLQALMDGRALTAAELARVAGVTAQTASGHLGKMAAAELLAVEKQGRHRYHRLAAPQVATMLESLMQVAAAGHNAAVVTGPRQESMRLARTCYDHIAGRLGVAISDAMISQGSILLQPDAGVVTEAGLAFLSRLGIVLDGMAPKGSSHRPLCRPCLDWSERRPHLAGRLGAALCTHALNKGWVRRRPTPRELEITPPGQHAFRELFGIGGLR